MLELALSAVITTLAQDPGAPVDAARIALQPDGTALIVRGDGTAPKPLFGSLAGERDGSSLWHAFQNLGLLGNLGLFLGSSRPLATMLDPERYCAMAGIANRPDALGELLAAPAAAGRRGRHAVDRLIAISLLARSEDPAARQALTRAIDGGDRFATAWAQQMLARGTAGRTPVVTARVDLASALATTPADAGVVVVIDHARLPEWRDLWRIMVEVGRAATRRDLESSGMAPDEVAAALGEADLLVERTHLLGCEVTRRFGNAVLARTVIAVPAAFTPEPGRPWLRFDGWFEPDRLEEGLRAEALTVQAADGAVLASLGPRTGLRADATSLTFSAEPAGEVLGPERAKALAAGFAVPHFAAGLVLRDDAALGEAPLPDTIRKLVDGLRGILLRHDSSEGALVWLELRYAEAGPAAAAATALGALLTVARASSAEAPAAVRRLLREIRIEREGGTITAEAELDEALGPWLEKLLPALGR